jgi:arylsulfatase A-like enzyme
MRIVARKLSDHVVWGSLFGAAAWSAYAVTEFIFTSVVYRLTRPYAMFTPWHWRLTALVAVGHIVCGLLAGALAGLLIGLSWRAEKPSGESADALESAAGLALLLALLLNMATGPGSLSGGSVQVASAIFFVVLLAIGMRNSEWRDRLGWIANPWIISFTWLGIGLVFSILRMRLGSQLGTRLDLASTGLAGVIALAAVAALIVGRMLRRGDSEGRWPFRLSFGSCAAAVLLLLASVGLSFEGGAVAKAESVGGAGTPDHPNLMIIVMDTVRADHLSINGYQRDTTPRLKALAQDSVVYLNAFSASDITLTSHASLFTGMYPSWHGAYAQPPVAVYGQELSPKYPTVAELLHREGYETLGVAANLYLRADFGLERGFDSFRIPRPVPLLPDEDRSILRYQLRRGLSFFTDTAQFDRLYTFGEDIDRDLFQALDQRARPTAPFFAFVNYMDAHFPYVPPAPYSNMYPGRRPRITQDDLQVEIDAISTGKPHPPGYQPHCESQYDGGIAYVDEQVGKIVDWLKRHNAYDNTMIVVTSDHGEAFGDKNRVGHANSPYQNLLHTALLIKYPHSSRKGVESQPVSLIDVAPTALASLKVAVPGMMQGLTLQGGAPSPRRIYAETFQNPVTHSPDCPDGCATKLVWEWPLKYVDNLTNRKPEFFDLSVDPNEQHNLFATQRERAAPLAGDLAEWSKGLPAQQVEVKRLNPTIENTLRGNGYVAK